MLKKCYRNEKIRRDVQSATQMISDWTIGANNKSSFQLAKYNPGFWANQGNNNYQKANNCYAYACNIRVDDKQLPRFSYPHPGFWSLGRAPRDRKELLDGLKQDGVVKIREPSWEPEVQVRGTTDQPAFLVVLGDGYTRDGNEYWYHFYRKVWSGNGTSCGPNSENCFYASKNGDDPVTDKTKGTSTRVIDPRVDMRARNLNYIGFFLIPQYLTICTPAIVDD